MIIRFFSQNREYKIDRKRIVKNWIQEILGAYLKEGKEINIVFTSSDYLKQINFQFLKHKYNTDVITFNYSKGNLLSGEIYIDYETVRVNANSYNVTFMHELLRVIIHGVLHLVGFDDSNEEERNKMRKLEDEALNILVSKYGFKF